MKIGLITKEWPPHIYGGAGVHALQLTQALRSSIDVDVHSFGAAREDATSHQLPARRVNSNSYSILLSITPDAIWELITGRSKPLVKPANELHYTRYGAIPIVRLNSIAHA